MGQLISFFQDIPIFFEEALNVALAVVTLLAIIKGIVNVWKSGILQLFVFLVLAGRSCSFKVGHHTNFESFTVKLGGVFHELPSLCRVNNSYSLIRLSHNSNQALSVEYVDVHPVLCSSSPTILDNYTQCIKGSPEFDWILGWTIKGLGHDFLRDPRICCEPKKTTNTEFTFQLNLTDSPETHHYRSKIEVGIRHLFGNYITNDSYSKMSVVMRNTSWEGQCSNSHVNTLRFLVKNAGYLVGRKPLAFFSWSLSDPKGNDMPGGYCLERWMLVAGDLKCFGNTAVAKCNLNHDSEFCDMLRLFDFNKNAIEKLNNQTKTAVNMLTHSINSLISDNLLMRNKLKEVLKVPYCNYTRFWYINHTKSGEHSLPRCWLVSNGSYLNESDFRNEWILESDHLIAEMLSKEYQDRQGKTPLTLVDLCFWSAIFFTTSLFLHLVGFPTHRHIQGDPCPLPHRLDRNGACRCGRYQKLGKQVTWKRKH
uniref:Pre-glycoprotein polyprotein GP complex n=1 Tax=Guanarito mammarenavirus (isolate Human/Venezuela/NH-95551/1990) TaxID=3052307 RepID=A1A3Z2_GTOVV|nr:glycoprotein precursor [Mammarenavirus guanaritoense]AAT72111.1 glycoprotein precursor [Mammarenavirus guanaritoense]ALE15095.1 pre-glycoprotein polyprotein Gp complex [Mammarenavirus guanaritoense]